MSVERSPARRAHLWLRISRRSVALEIRHVRRMLARRLPRVDLPAVEPLALRRGALVTVAVAAALGASAIAVQWGLPREAALMAGIFALAALLWTTEALSLFATALLVMALQVVLLANPGGWPGIGFEGAGPDYRTFLAPLADPIVFLFLGGFVLARAAVKEHVDAGAAAVVLRPFRGGPRRTMLGLMVATALFSMFMSNTAATAMMLALLGPVLATVPAGDPVRRGLVLAVPFAANIGGMGTPVSSPPNAVALGVLTGAGHPISFVGWMAVAVPLALLLLVAAWLLLGTLYRPATPGLHFAPEARPIGRRGRFVLLVGAVTILGWLTEGLHGLPTAVVALLPVVAFTATGVLDREDIDTLQWNVLILIAGGIALGRGVEATGLDVALVEALPLGGTLAVATLVLTTLVLSTFMSNTAAANLILPIGVSVAVAGAGMSPTVMAVSIALIASCAMALPVSTPPNALAYAQGEVEPRDLLLSGSLLGMVALALIVGLGPLVIAFWLG